MMRYLRNKTTISAQENDVLKASKVCVVGCGGLGGYSIEMLGRVGVGTITAIDGDVFDETNLNRQLLANEATIGQSKAMVAQKRMKLVNPEVTVTPINQFLREENAEALVNGHDVIIDALDEIQTRLLVQGVAEKLSIPFVHGAIAGWYGQVSTIFPGERTLNKIYKPHMSSGQEKELGNPSFTPALVSSMQVSEVIKIILQRGTLLRNKLLFCNLLEQEYDVIEL
ncbi:MAG: HesA/MoeB/ThiF family protein [Firmicutes bacterium]|nr:HesA/MoeB/ThiF family protein [Bacillota bacterium]